MVYHKFEENMNSNRVNPISGTVKCGVLVCACDALSLRTRCDWPASTSTGLVANPSYSATSSRYATWAVRADFLRVYRVIFAIFLAGFSMAFRFMLASCVCGFCTVLQSFFSCLGVMKGMLSRWLCVLTLNN